MPHRRDDSVESEEDSRSSRTSSSGSLHRQMVGFKGDRWLEVFRKRREHILDCFRRETASALGVSPDAITDIVCTAGAFMIDFAVDSDDPEVQERLDALVESCPYESVWEIYFREMANRDPRDMTATPCHNTVTSTPSSTGHSHGGPQRHHSRSSSPGGDSSHRHTSPSPIKTVTHHEPSKSRERSGSASSVSRSSAVSLHDQRDSRSASPIEHVGDQPDHHHHHHHHHPSRPEKPREGGKGHGRRPPHSVCELVSGAADDVDSRRYSSPKKHTTTTTVAAAPPPSQTQASSSSVPGSRGGVSSSSGGRTGGAPRDLSSPPHSHHTKKPKGVQVTRHWIGFEGERWATILHRGGATARREIEESFLADLENSEAEAGISDPVLYSCVYDPEKIGLVIECDWSHSRSLTSDEVDHRLSSRFSYDRLWDLYFDEPKRSASNPNSARTLTGGASSSSAQLHTEAHSIGFEGPGWRETVRDDWADICEAFVLDVLAEQGSRVHAVFVAGYDLLHGLILNADITYVNSISPKEMDQRLKAGTYDRVWEVYHDHQARRGRHQGGDKKDKKKKKNKHLNEEMNKDGSLSLPPIAAEKKKSSKKR